MTVSRPTFHESWYRVGRLRPRLLRSVRVYRQHFRGQMWYVLEDTTTNQFSRISREAYRFVAMLDGRRSVTDVWRLCNEQLGDNALTQPEVIQLLGRLYCANLLQAELAPDTESLFSRYRQRIRRQVQGHFMNLLFIRIPLLDPDHFLERWVGIFGRVFSRFGLVLWSVLLAAGFYFVVGNWGEFSRQSSDILAPDNLILLSVSFWFIKILHEFSHSFACRKFGQLSGHGGQVHTMGIMFLVFFPLPYMDASSAWAFRRKWHRVIVGAAGMMAELSIASVAAIVWANTSVGTVHIIAHNIIFIASVSTLLFNGNPLLRFDGYYILSDLIEIPNLATRSRGYLYYLVKKYCWGLKMVQNPAGSLGERLWFVFFCLGSTVYRVFICIRILFFLNDRLPEELFVVVPVLAFGAIITWVFVPLGKFVRFLATSGELLRNRRRALLSTLGAISLVLIATAVVRVRDYVRAEGIVEPVRSSFVHAGVDGFVEDFLPSVTSVCPDEAFLIKAANPELESEKKQLDAERRLFEARRRMASTSEPAEAQILDEQIAALDEKIERVRSELSLLNLQPSICGVWVAPDIELTKGMYLRRGQRIGFVGSLDDVLIRVTVGQNDAILIDQAYKVVSIRVKGRPDMAFSGRIDKILPAGQEFLPSAALGYAAGGSIATVARDRQGTRSAERFFEIKISPDANSPVRLLSGQRVAARFQMPRKPLAFQWWRSLRQLFQRRFRI